MTDRNEYFASRPTAEIGKLLVSKVEDDRATASIVSRRRDIYTRAALYYFGSATDGISTASAVQRGGDQGELALVRVNHARSLVQTLLSLILSAKVIWEALANNSDYESAAQTIVAQAVLEQYWKDFDAAAYAARALEEAIVFGDGFIYAPWDESLGDDIPDAPRLDPETGEAIGFEKTGDFKFQNPSTWDVIRDPYKRSFEQLDWVIIHLRENRFNVAAEAYRQALKRGVTPEDARGLSSKILNAATDLKLDERGTQLPGVRNTDDISVFHFYHKKTAALPSGRETFFVDSDIILHDGPLSYDRIPLYRVRAADLFATPYGYTSFFEILGPQELVDSLETCIATNQTTFGTQMVAAPMGTDVSPDSFGGMKMLFYPAGGGVPQALQLTKSPPEIFQHLKDLIQHMEQLMGLNSVVRGMANSGEQSGSALALLSNQAKQQSSALEGDFYRCLRSFGQGIIETIRRKDPPERTVAIAGKANRSLVKTSMYSGKDFSTIHRVNVDIGNPLSQTIAGRTELAKMYLQMLGPGKMLPEQIEQVIATGRMESLVGGLQKQLLLILHENETIRAGEVPPVLADDDHALHMRGHEDEGADPQLREDAKALQALSQHQSWHWNEYLHADPARLMVLGQQPPPQLVPPGGAPPGPGGPPPPGGPGAPPPAPPGDAPGPKDAPPPAKMPIDKSTGQRAPTTGPPMGS